MFFTELETERLLLKIIDEDDAEFILRQFSNDDVNRWLFDAEPYTCIEDAEDIIRYYNEEEPRNQNRWIMIRKDDGEKVGTCGFHCWNRDLRTCELGYDLYPTYVKNGYMSEALSAILRFASDEMKVKTIEAHIADGNMDSVKTALRQGFTDSKRTYMEIFRGKEYLHHIYVRNFE